jgi:riboflavin biosynthesis pyrimidine reductase
LRRIYDGDLQFDRPAGRPYVVGNFVSTVDGAVSYNINGRSGGDEISGFSQTDRFVMGLLRASADAVVMGAGTLGDFSHEHTFVGESAFPEGARALRSYRLDVLKKSATPAIFVVSGRGTADLTRAVFQTQGLRSVVLTTREGKEAMLDRAGRGVQSMCAEIQCLNGPVFAPDVILDAIAHRCGAGLVIHEGGPQLIGGFFASGLVDELCLTISPRLAGRLPMSARPSIASRFEFIPETSPMLSIMSVKIANSLLFLRYRVGP